VRYLVRLQSDSTAAPVPVVLVEGPNGALSATVDGREVELDAIRIGAQLSVRVGGKVVDMTVGGMLPDLAIVAGDLRSRAHVEGDRTRSVATTMQRAALAKTLCTLYSPMPGRVVRIAVAAGEAVLAGQTLVVLEAMKMENEVIAAQPGTVLEVHVTPGAAVEANAKLITLAPGTGEAPSRV
jgi:biotin carboxyl carrier protein